MWIRELKCDNCHWELARMSGDLDGDCVWQRRSVNVICNHILFSIFIFSLWYLCDAANEMKKKKIVGQSKFLLASRQTTTIQLCTTTKITLRYKNNNNYFLFFISAVFLFSHRINCHQELFSCIIQRNRERKWTEGPIGNKRDYYYYHIFDSILKCKSAAEWTFAGPWVNHFDGPLQCSLHIYSSQRSKTRPYTAHALSVVPHYNSTLIGIIW